MHTRKRGGPFSPARVRPAVLALVLILALPCASRIAQARYFTAQGLYDALNSGEADKYDQARGYVMGVYDSFEGVIFKPRVELGPDKLVEVVDRYMKAHPDEEVFSAQLLVLRALEDYAKTNAGEKKSP